MKYTNLFRELQDDNDKLVTKVAKVELHVQELKAGKNDVLKNHIEEMTNRDRQEMIICL